ncbi:MAG: hypothetical protein ACRCTI_11515 [Beijerinckiaceae bacterium]
MTLLRSESEICKILANCGTGPQHFSRKSVHCGQSRSRVVEGNVMDTGLNVRPVPPVGSAPVRIDPPVARQTVAPELPDAQAVTAATEDAPVRFNEEAGSRDLRAALNSAIDTKVGRLPVQPVSKVAQDEATKELIFRKVNPETGQIIGQFPEEAALRLKAYNAQQRREEAESARTFLA